MLYRILYKLGILDLFYKYRFKRRIRKEREREEALVINNFSEDKFEALTLEEKTQVDSLWGNICNIEVTSYREFEMFKKLYGFDARFLTHNIYLPVISHLLNDYKYTKIFEDKGLLGYIKSDTCIRFPKCFIRRIVSDYYDGGMHQITLDKSIDICASEDELFVKPSHDTSSGIGTQLIQLKKYDKDERKKILREEFLKRKDDFVVQECLHQHPVMAQFNETSVNTFRITTLLLNNKYSLCSIVLRCGKNGSNVDNWGAGGLMIYVTPEGKVNSIAHDIKGNTYKTNGKCVLGECTIPQMPKILEMVEKCHREDFAICKFIGWDIAIDQNGEPVIVELNSSQPGVIGEQLVNGPIFGDRTQEVIDYCKSKEFVY